MSSISQTPLQAAPRTRRSWVRFALALAAAALIVGVSLRGVWGSVVAAAGRARLHGPDMALWGHLPLAIKLHLLAALAALVLGAVLMTQRKGGTFHRTAGWLWVGLVSMVVGTSLFINGLNNGRFSILHLFTAWTLIILPLAVVWARRHAVSRHRGAMRGLFYGGFAINIFVAFIPGRTLWMLLFG